MDDNLVEEARRTAEHAHEDDEFAGRPYFTHVARVAESVQGTHAKTLAFLHDVLEKADDDFPEEELRRKFGDEIVDAVVAMTQDPDEPYADFILRVATNALATEVKIPDLSDNLGHKHDLTDEKRDLYILAQVFLERIRDRNEASPVSSIAIRDEPGGAVKASIYLHPVSDDLVVTSVNIVAPSSQAEGNNEEEWLIIPRHHKDAVLLGALNEPFDTSSSFCGALRKWLEANEIPHHFFST